MNSQQLNIFRRRLHSTTTFSSRPDEHKDLVEHIENPSREFIENKAQKLNLVVVPEEEHKDILSKIMTPSKEYIHSKASALGLVVLEDEEHKLSHLYVGVSFGKVS